MKTDKLGSYTVVTERYIDNNLFKTRCETCNRKFSEGDKAYYTKVDMDTANQFYIKREWTCRKCTKEKKVAENL